MVAAEEQKQVEATAAKEDANEDAVGEFNQAREETKADAHEDAVAGIQDQLDE